MTLSTDPMLETPLVLKERRPFSLLLTCEKQDKSRMDLTGTSVTLVIADVVRKGGAAKITAAGTLVSAVDGTVRFDVQGDEVVFGTGMFDLAITLRTVEGYTATIVEGPVEVTHNPDTTVPLDYSTVVPPLSLTARFRDYNRVTVRTNHLPDSLLQDFVERAEAAAATAVLNSGDISGSVSAAANSAAAAAAAADSASGSAGSASASATNAAASATSAEASAAAAATSETNASAASSTSTTQATTATDAATSASLSATSAGASATSAQDSAAAAQTAQTAAEAAAADAQNVVDNDTSLVRSTTVDNIVTLTQAAYDALVPKVATTLYVIVG